jgi:DNA repair protein SbcC/Rad50
LANQTPLSAGDLTIELDDSADGGDEAFALRVRVGNAPMPTGVNYLSGSQKFRVAVSIALAIGRFAAGQARPLESVIIDEGFGSLDRDGLRAVANELNRLRQHLRRIVLVSHQDDFADRFPVVIKLTHGENGTTAEALRR